MKIIKVKYLLFLILSFQFSCVNKNQDQFLIEKINKLESELNEHQKELFIQNDELRILYLINSQDNSLFKQQILNNVKDSLLIIHFKNNGIINVIDMRNILLTSLHRKINKKPIEIQNQINERVRVLKLLDDCKLLELKKIEISKSFKIGDTIQIRLKIYNDGIAYQTECELLYPEWVFDNKTDLLIQGKILKKYTYKEVQENEYLEILITNINKNFVQVGLDFPKIDDLFEITINYAILEKINNVDIPPQTEHLIPI